MIELPGYQLIRELGQGGMARVYLALHEGLDRHVAIKIMYPNLSSDKSFSERFLREARIIARLNHPNIITVFDVNVHNAHHYIAMEYLPGESLGDKIKARITPDKALIYLKQIATGLNFAHSKGFIHRDIKPENILFREDGTAVITDFGVARAELSDTKMTQTGTIIGTPHYMSPEQAQGIEVKPSSDIYSLGIVFYEMLAGVVPYRADSIVAIMYKHVNEPIPELVNEFKIFQPLLNKLLAKKASDRYQSADDIIKDIEYIELRVEPDMGETRIRPPKKIGGITAKKRNWFSPIKRPVFRKNYVIVVTLFSLASVFGVILGLTLTDNNQQLSNSVVIKDDKRLSEYKRLEVAQQRQDDITKQKQLEAQRLKQEELARKRLRQEKYGSERLVEEKEKQRLAKALRKKQNEAHIARQKIRQLIVSAKTHLKKNQLNTAYRLFLQVKNIDPDNKEAKKGFNHIAGKYLAFAVKNAESSKFEKADAYLQSANKVFPNHPQLAATQQQVTALKNNQEKNILNQNATKNVSKKQRSFGGF